MFNPSNLKQMKAHLGVVKKSNSLKRWAMVRDKSVFSVPGKIDFLKLEQLIKIRTID